MVFGCAFRSGVSKISVESDEVAVVCLLDCRDVVLCIQESCLAFDDGLLDLLRFLSCVSVGA